MTPQGRTGARGSRRLARLGPGDAGGLEVAPLVERQVDRRRRRVAPGLGRVAGDRAHIGAGLERQAGLGGDEARRPRLAAVVGDGREADVAEVAAELGQVARRGDQRLGRVERVAEAAQLRRLRHELGDPLRAGRADRRGVEQALLPEQPGEEVAVEAVLPRRRLDQPADVGDVGRLLRRNARGPGCSSPAPRRGRRCAASARPWPARRPTGARPPPSRRGREAPSRPMRLGRPPPGRPRALREGSRIRAVMAARLSGRGRGSSRRVKASLTDRRRRRPPVDRPSTHIKLAPRPPCARSGRLARRGRQSALCPSVASSTVKVVPTRFVGV